MSDTSEHTPAPGGRPLTGRHVLMIALGAFGIIIAANLTMLFAALGSFPGLEVKNSYVASQHFDARRSAQEALGWQSTVTEEAGALRIALLTAEGVPARPETISLTIGRPSHDREDLVLTPAAAAGGAWRVEAPLTPGLWRVEIAATAADGTAFATRHDLHVRAAE
ncbi:MAG: FixH family protein [Pseudomonadota bacterium]